MNYTVETCSRKKFCSFCDFLKTAQSKKKPKRRIVAQSGHPDREQGQEIDGMSCNEGSACMYVSYSYLTRPNFERTTKRQKGRFKAFDFFVPLKRVQEPSTKSTATTRQ
jgi:hypothetical protein